MIDVCEHYFYSNSIAETIVTVLDEFHQPMLSVGPHGVEQEPPSKEWIFYLRKSTDRLAAMRFDNSIAISRETKVLLELIDNIYSKKGRQVVQRQREKLHDYQKRSKPRLIDLIKSDIMNWNRWDKPKVWMKQIDIDNW